MTNPVAAGVLPASSVAKAPVKPGTLPEPPLALYAGLILRHCQCRADRQLKGLFSLRIAWLGRHFDMFLVVTLDPVRSCVAVP